MKLSVKGSAQIAIAMSANRGGGGGGQGAAKSPDGRARGGGGGGYSSLGYVNVSEINHTAKAPLESVTVRVALM